MKKSTKMTASASGLASSNKGRSLGPSVRVAMCTDDAYVLPTAVTMASLLAHAEPGSIEILVHVGPSFRHQDLLRRVCAQFDGEARFIETNDAAVRTGLTGAAYQRLFLADYLPDIDRLIYLDSDILVRRDLRPLWLTKLRPSDDLAAVRDGWGMTHGRLRAACGGRYFNSGVLVLNLDSWRAKSIGPRVAALITGWRNGELTTAPDGTPLGGLPELTEQTALNLIMQGAWTDLAPEWNMTKFVSREIWPLMGYADPAWPTGADDPAIAHFAGRAKPWIRGFADCGPFHREYANWMKELEPIFAGHGATWPQGTRFGPDEEIGLAAQALDLITRAKRSGCRRAIVFGLNALSRKVIEVAASQGFPIVGIATAGPVHASGQFAGLPVEPIEVSLGRDCDAIIAGERRTVASTLCYLRDAARRANRDIVILALNPGD